MVVWILVLPATAFLDAHPPAPDDVMDSKNAHDDGTSISTGSSYSWRHVLRTNIEQQTEILPRKLLTKYEGETLVAWTHILPSVYWVIAIPLQFNPNIQRKYRSFHRFVGRAFVLTSCVMMVGFVIILQRGLSYENYLEDVEPLMIPGTTDLSSADAFLYVLASVFLCFAFLAVRCARRKDYVRHRYWMIRHCSCGLWVIVQRVLALCASMLYALWRVKSAVDITSISSGGGSSSSSSSYDDGSHTAAGVGASTGDVSDYIRGKVFFFLGLIAIVMSIGMGEYTIALLKRLEEKKND